MFGFGKNKKTDKRGKNKKPKELQASVQGKKNKGKTPNNRGKSESQCIREEALAHARAARAHIGEDTVQKIAAAMAKKGNNPFEKAKSQLQNADSDRITDEILYMLNQK